MHRALNAFQHNFRDDSDEMTDGADFTFNTFRDVLNHLERLGLFHMDLGLGRMRRFLLAQGLERPPFITVQVLGTNGKGSTASLLASLCAAHGCRTGLYTSPHFVSPLERICIDGRPLPEEQWLQAANRLGECSWHLTYFEWLTALAASLFRQNGVDVAIFEAGLGGRHDATTAVKADLLCFTPIAVDHRNMLGESLSRIAADKAAAIRDGVVVVTAAQYPRAAECLAGAARRHGARLHQARAIPKDSPLRPNLAGPHQLRNAGLAFAAWRFLAPKLGREADNAEAQKRGLRRAFLPGRMQRLPGGREYPDLLLDGAHNPHGMKTLVEALQDSGIRPARVVFSCLADKDWRTSAMLLKRFVGDAPVYIPALRNLRAASVAEMTRAWNGTVPRTARPVENISAALSALNGASGISSVSPVLFTGSLYLLAEFFALYPGALQAGFAGGPAGQAHSCEKTCCCTAMDNLVR
ncbi:MAG: bifunctional folylpolyglutamate synthase/ dihydrofolate synthase [Desulfovibrio sp.]|jgi:dihydrofolate synthase/folylpolyglutamate synthase|nr:bifunctional folylpolyglutamate synthase/ dihydrofolate synthase [Desulfovibrio sp.]